MRKKLGNLLLLLGTVFGALCAADSKRGYRARSLADDQAVIGARLFQSVELGTGEGAETIPAGEELTPELVARLRAAGRERVRVRYPARAEENLAVGEDALGRVLAHPVVLAAESESFRAGRVVTADLRERAEAAGVALPEPPSDSLEEADEGPQRLAAELSLPARLRTDAYLDLPTLERLRASGVERVDVRIPPTFHLADWRLRYGFLAAIAAMVAGAFLKRARPIGGGAEEARAVESTAALARRFDALHEGVRALAARAGGLDADGLHAALDPLLSGPAYDFLEGRDAIRAAHGLKAYAIVMGPFASVERKLNRAWSAAVDDATDEARDCLQGALPFLEETAAALEPYRTGSRPTP